MFYLADFTEDLSPRVTQRLVQRGKGRAIIYRSFWKNKRENMVRTSEYYCYLKKTRHLKLMNLVLFYVWEGARVWAH